MKKRIGWGRIIRESLGTIMVIALILMLLAMAAGIWQASTIFGIIAMVLGVMLIILGD